jgi:outer membrane biosynthesis protein TonB
MPDSADQACFLEQTDFTILMARCSGRRAPLRVDQIREVPTGDAAVLAEAVRGMFPANDTPVICALRPKTRQVMLASDEQTRLHVGFAGVQQLQREAGNPNGRFAAVNAADGHAPTTARWLATATSAEAHAQGTALLASLKLKPARLASATLVDIGAVAKLAKEIVLVLELGELTSHALLVGPDGVIATAPVSLNLDKIAEASQLELNLKFRGSGAKLFLNPDYDFGESAAKVVGRIAPSVKTELAALLQKKPTPTAFFCAGLPAKQFWFSTHLATELGLKPFLPDLKACFAAAGVTFADAAIEAEVSPSWLGLFNLIGGHLTDASQRSWQSEWLAVDGPVPAVAAPPAKKAAPAPTPAPVPVVEKPAAVPAQKPAPPPAKPAPVPTPAPAAKAPATKASSVAYSTEPVAPKPVAAAPREKKTAEPSRPAQPAPASSSSAQASPSKPLFKNPLVLIAAGVTVAIVAGVLYFLQAQKSEAARLAAEKVRAEKQLREETEKARIAEEKARTEAESRKHFESELSQKLAAAEAARQQAEAEARNQVAARLANARGSLVVNTEPAGAMVTVGSLAPRPSPATFTDIKIGKYPVKVALRNYDEEKLELEVKENETVESGVIRLSKQTGSLALTTDPAGAEYTVRPAGMLLVTGDALRTGKTPDTLADLVAGDYSVTFNRPGWEAHAETVSVGRNATATAAWKYPNGKITIVSTPAGATVTRDGQRLGATPLTLADQPPGDVDFEVSLAGFDPATVHGRVDGGKSLELNAKLLSVDRIMGMNEIDQKPVPISMVNPEIPPELKLKTERVDISLVIDRTGTPHDLQVIRASSAQIGNYCLAAAAKWKFKPAMKAGKPVNVRVVLPFTIEPPQ